MFEHRIPFKVIIEVIFGNGKPVFVDDETQTGVLELVGIMTGCTTSGPDFNRQEFDRQKSRVAEHLRTVFPDLWTDEWRQKIGILSASLKILREKGKYINEGNRKLRKPRIPGLIAYNQAVDNWLARMSVASHHDVLLQKTGQRGHAFNSIIYIIPGPIERSPQEVVVPEKEKFKLGIPE